MVLEKHGRDEESGGVAEDKAGKTIEMGTSSNSRSFEVESWAFVAHQNYSLQLMQRVDTPLEGDAIPATLQETLAFFRVYTSTVGNSQLLPLVIYDFNRFIWNCVFNLLMKSLPLNYIIFFLSSYVPHEHMFINKMVPLMYGYNVLMIFSLLTNFCLSIEATILAAYYALQGIFYMAPWTRCSERSFYEVKFNHTVHCIGLKKLCKMASTLGESFATNYPYVVGSKEKGSITILTAAPLIFYHRVAQWIYWEDNETARIRLAIITAVILIVIGSCRRLIYKRIIWQIVKYSNWILTLLYLGAMCHIFVAELEKEEVTKKVKKASVAALRHLDYEMLADLMGSPPLLHYIASRSNRQKNPTEDSAVLVFSNSINYIIKGVVLYMIKKYSDNLYQMSFMRITNINVIFIYWPVYLTFIPLGSLFGAVLFLLQGLSEFLSFVIAYNIALECIQSTFPKVKWWLMLLITLPYVVLFRMYLLSPGYLRRTLAYVLVKGIIALAEMIIIICLYPISRLEDDITFHTGSPPAKIMSVAMRLTPLYFGVKLYLIMITKYDMIAFMRNVGAMNFFLRFLLFLFGLLVIGILWPITRNLCIKRQNWRSLFRPVPEWGPKDHIQRQLRKQYDSREYIASTASRYLSRYLKSKLSSRMYRLDVCYETDRGRRRSTVAALQPYSLHIDDETKKDV